MSDQPKPPSQPASAMSAESDDNICSGDQNCKHDCSKSEYAKSVETECDRLKQRYAKLVKAISVAECLPGCDAYGHEEKCPNASVAERLVAAEADLDQLKQAANLLLDYIEDHGWGLIPEPYDSINPLLKLLGRDTERGVEP